MFCQANLCRAGAVTALSKVGVRLLLNHPDKSGDKKDTQTLDDLSPENSVFRSRSNSSNWTWNNRLAPKRKGICQGCILSPCLFNLYAEYIMRNAGLDEAHTGIKIAGRNINNLRYADDTTLKGESEEELKNPLRWVKVE